MNVRARHIEFTSTDGLLLPALLFEPKRKTSDVAVFLHGNGDSSVFYSPARMNAFASALADRGIAFFAFNNRGAHLARKLKRVGRRKRVLAGTTYERIAESVRDIDGAVTFLRGEKLSNVHLVGHSTGANKICVYEWKKKRSQIRRIVLIAGGDDLGIYYQNLGARRFERVLDRARARVAEGGGYELAPRTTGPFPLSWRALLDTLRPSGDYNIFPFFERLHDLRITRGKKPFREFASIRRPVLSVYGSEDEFCFGRVDECVDILKDAAAGRPNFHYSIIDGAGHNFEGYEETLAREVAEFLSG